MSETLVGVVDHWFGKIKVAGVEITADQLSAGDTIRFAGSTTDFETVIDSMQIDHESVLNASKGDQVGMKVPERVRVGDLVYRITAD